MANDNFIKSVTSKDFNRFKDAIQNLINSKNLTLFNELNEKSDFLFPFVKEKIIKNFVNLIQKNNLDVVFEFSKIYSYDFEDLIIKSLLKFADEDLTDEILNLFETGTDEQKAYCAKYFSYIKDPLALELLTKNAYSSFDPLRTNCAIAFGAFGYEKIIDDMKNIIETDDDDFKKLNALQFLISYNNPDLICYIIKKAYSSPFVSNIITYLKDTHDLDTLNKYLSDNDIARIFSILIENYPENISLDSVIPYEIFNFIKLLSSKERYNQYIENIFIIAKNKFSEFSNNEIYNYDLDQDTKTEIDEILKLLSNFDFKLENLKEELDCYNNLTYRYETALNAVKIMNYSKYSEFLAYLINENKLNYVLMAQTAITLKELNKENLIDKSKIETIENKNVKALILSLL